MQGLRRELGLAIAPCKPRGRRLGGCTGLPTKAEQPDPVWTWDFIHDKTIRGSMKKTGRLAWAPQYMLSDNGSVPRSEATTCEAIY